MMSSERQRLIREVPYDDASVPLIADTLGADQELAPFTMPGIRIVLLLVLGEAGRPNAMLTLWPSIRRVDVIGGAATVVFTQVEHVKSVEGIEVLFRRASGESLIVARGGKVIVRA